MKHTTKLVLAATTAALIAAGCGSDGIEITVGDAVGSPTEAVETAPGSVSVSVAAGDRSWDPIDPFLDGTLVLPDGWFEMWGYGTVLRVEGDEITPHYVTTSTCTVGESFDNELRVDHAGDDGGVITVDLVGPSTDYRLRPLTGPADCPPLAETAAVAESVRALDELFDRHYPFFEQRGIDWNRELAAIRRASEADPTDFDPALARFMVALADGHTSLVGLDIEPDIGAFGLPGVTTIDDLEVAVGSELDATLARLEDVRTDPSGAVGWGILPGDTARDSNSADIGYLILAGFGGLDDDPVAGRDALVEALDDAIADLAARSDRLVIDLRFNAGGYEDLAVIAAGYFVGQPTPAYHKWPHAQPDHIVQTIEVVPQAARFDGDVAVVTSPLTASAAEVFALAMVAVADATVIGSPSFGEFSDAIDWVLPNGTELTLSMEVYTDLDGTGHETIGVPVDLPTPFDQAIDAANDHLQSTR